MTLFSEKVLISNRYISGLMSNLIKKSWTVSSLYLLGESVIRGSEKKLKRSKISSKRTIGSGKALQGRAPFGLIEFIDDDGTGSRSLWSKLLIPSTLNPIPTK